MILSCKPPLKRCVRQLLGRISNIVLLWISVDSDNMVILVI